MPNESHLKVKKALRNFVKTEIILIRSERGKYNSKHLKKESEFLYNKLILIGENPGSAWQHVEDCMRYIAFYLADNARHTEAMQSGIILNNARAHYQFKQGHLLRWFSIRIIKGFGFGYGFRPLRVLRAAIIFWVFFSILFSIIILINNNTVIIQDKIFLKPFEYIIHSCFLSAYSILSLNYEFLKPNLLLPSGRLLSVLIIADTLLGYISLGIFISVFFSRSMIHPYARISQWLEDFDNNILNIKLGKNYNFYDFKSRSSIKKPSKQSKRK